LKQLLEKDQEKLHIKEQEEKRKDDEIVEEEYKKRTRTKEKEPEGHQRKSGN
jgi:hypothetical protein